MEEDEEEDEDKDEDEDEDEDEEEDSLLASSEPFRMISKLILAKFTVWTDRQTDGQTKPLI